MPYTALNVMLHHFAGKSQLDLLQWHRADCVKVRFGGRKRDQG